VRVVNASPDSPPLDVLFNGTRQISGLAYGSAATYLLLSSANYTVTFNNAATGATLLTVNPVALGVAQTATLYVVGPAEQMGSLFTRDN
jgi:hypothetical protein